MLNMEYLWNSPFSDVTLNIDEVHLWQANLNLPEWRIQKLIRILSPDERLRAGRFVFDIHRRKFIAARGILRTILGRYVNLEPSQLKFSYGYRGKPELASSNLKRTLCFNLSHSHEIALYVVAYNRSVGVDVEHMQQQRNIEHLARSIFFPKEIALINSLPPEQKREEFFKGWTIKEAYLKATGEGLSGMDKVEVSLSPGEPATLLNIQGNHDTTTFWSSCQIIPSQGYLATLVVEGKGWQLNRILF